MDSVILTAGHENPWPYTQHSITLATEKPTVTAGVHVAPCKVPQ